MKNSKIKKIIKIAVIVLLVLVVLIAAATYYAIEFVIKPRSEQILNAVEQFIKDEEIIKEIEPFLESEELEAILNQTEVLDQIDEEVAPESAKPSTTDEKNNVKPNKKTETTKKPTTTPKPSEEPKKDKEEYSSKTEYIKDNVSASDFSKGVSYASRVDVGYVMGIVSGGLTAEEKKELKAYLKERFSSGEIAEGISLYSKYSHLLK